MRISITELLLRDMAHHVKYRRNMLVACNSRLLTTQRDSESWQVTYAATATYTSTSQPFNASAVNSRPADGVMENALLEALLIHFRWLRDFFYADNPDKDDCVAGDFFPDATEWSVVRPSLPEDVDGLRAAVNKHLAHPTYHPVLYGKRAWKHDLLTGRIVSAYDAFLGRLAYERREWFRP